MVQEDKELLLQDLCTRLLYGVKCQIKGEEDFEPLKLKSFIQGKGFYAFDFYIKENSSLTFKELDEFKPYLFPLSSMTEEQKEELNRITNGKFNSHGTYIDNCKPRNWSEWGTTEYNWIRHHDVDLLHTWLDKNHFDYRGLIPMGLAIDCTNLNIY